MIFQGDPNLLKTESPMVLSKKIEVEDLVITVVRPSAESTRLDTEYRLSSLYCLQWLPTTEMKAYPLDFLPNICILLFPISLQAASGLLFSLYICYKVYPIENK